MELVCHQVMELLLVPPLCSWEFGKSDHLRLCWGTDTSRLPFQALRSQQLLLSLFSNSESLDLVRPSKIIEFPYEEALEDTIGSGEYSNICLFQCFLFFSPFLWPKEIFFGFYFSSEMAHCNSFP